MSYTQQRCPVCGFVNLDDAARCQWCALALQDRARAESSHDADARAGKPWGLLMIPVALLIMGGGVFWHVTRKVEAGLQSPAAAADSAAKPRKRGGPPSLSDRRSDDESDRMLANPHEMLKQGYERNEAFKRVIEDHERGVYGGKDTPPRLRDADPHRIVPARRPRPAEESQPTPDDSDEP